MIRIQSKNPLFRATLVSALSEFEATDTELPEEETAVLLVCDTQEEVDELLRSPLSCAIVLLGTHHAEADLEIPLPCALNELKERLRVLIAQRQNAPTFENKTFLFEGAKRLLTHKKTKHAVPLTEKETELISYLVKALPNPVSKTDLLSEVWKYNPDVESHTVETHIYSLRQKIGEENADNFIVNTADGYILSEK